MVQSKRIKGSSFFWSHLVIFIYSILCRIHEIIKLKLSLDIKIDPKEPFNHQGVNYVKVLSTHTRTVSIIQSIRLFVCLQ